MKAKDLVIKEFKNAFNVSISVHNINSMINGNDLVKKNIV